MRRPLKIFGALFACALAALGRPACAQTYVWSTLAGRPTSVGTADGTGGNARFNNPWGAATDAAGNLYLADTDNHTIRKVTPAGIVSTLAGSPGLAGSADGPGGVARFDQPYGVAVDAAGNVLVADYGNHTIRVISPAGVVSTRAGLARTSGSADGTGATARFNQPQGVAVDRDGNIYVADSSNCTVRKITTAGLVSTLAGAAGLGGTADGAGGLARFVAPAYLALDAAGNIYVSDNGASTIRKLSAAGVVTTLAGTANLAGSANGAGSAARFFNPTGIAVSPAGEVFVGDSNNNLIRKITAAGAVTTFAGGATLRGYVDGTGAAARFFYPTGLALDGSGNLYVVDGGNATVRKITPAAVVSTLAGPGGNFGSADGAGAAAQFNLPLGIAVDRTGNVFVADSSNYTVRRISPAGATTTVAGRAGIDGPTDGTAAASRFGYPFGIAADSQGQLFVADSVNNTIRQILASGSVRTFAGQSSVPGTTDDGGADARFNEPRSVAIDRDGNLFVADSRNFTIRKITPLGAVSTIAGQAGQAGVVDGSRNAARFRTPGGLAVDAQGNVYVAEITSHTIRRIAPDGTVSTIAGLTGISGSVDGTGSAARFFDPQGLAIDAEGNLIVADGDNQTIRRITPGRDVTTIGGDATTFGHADGSGKAARFLNPNAVAVDGAGAIYVAEYGNNVIRKGVLAPRPVIAAQPQAQAIDAGGSATFTVVAAGGGISFQWRLNGTAIAGATGSSYTVSNATASAAGSYTVDVSNSGGITASNPATLTVAAVEVGRLANLAIRSQAGTGPLTLIVGFTIGGAGTGGTKPILLRGVGPTLGVFGVPGLLADPKLELFSGANKIDENDDWAGNAQVAAIGAQTGAFALGSGTSKDAALYNAAFNAGSYSAWITGAGGATGVALAEIYDATPANAHTPTTLRLTNVSARTQVGTGGDILIAGFTITGQASKTVLIRAIGPTLGVFGVTGTLADPKLELFSGATRIDGNDDWGGGASLANAFVSVGAFPLQGTTRDAALLVTLAPGSYTAQVSGVGGTTGVALVEVYEVP